MKVVWTDYALHSLEIVQGYIEANNPSSAKRVIRQVKITTKKLSQFPNIGRVGARGTRQLVVSNLPYIIVYRVLEGQVQIVRVFHDKQLVV